MRLRLRCALVAIMGWTLVSVPATAAGDPTLTIIDPTGVLAGTYVLENYVQNHFSFTATTAFNSSSARLLTAPPGQSFMAGSIRTVDGGATLDLRLKTCQLTSANSASSGANTTIHLAVTCGEITDSTTSAPSPTPTPKPTPKPTPTATPTPAAVLIRPLAVPAVKK